VEAEAHLLSQASLIQMFRGTDLRRTLISIGSICCEAASGVGFMSKCTVLVSRLIYSCIWCLFLYRSLNNYQPHRHFYAYDLLGNHRNYLFPFPQSLLWPSTHHDDRQYPLRFMSSLRCRRLHRHRHQRRRCISSSSCSHHIIPSLL